MKFLNTLTSSSTSFHKLILKVGIPIMLLRNLSPTKRLCNSTKLIVKNLKQYIIEAEIITGTYFGQRYIFLNLE